MEKGLSISGILLILACMRIVGFVLVLVGVGEIYEWCGNGELCYGVLTLSDYIQVAICIVIIYLTLKYE